MKTIAKCCAAALVAALVAGAALGMINPDFTPVDLVWQSGSILIVSGEDIGEGVEIILTVDRAMKGEAPDTVKLNIGGLPDGERGELAGLLAKEKALIFIAEAEDAANLNIDGRWFPLEPADGGGWKALQEDTQFGGLLATWRGGTDMLMRCVEYILEYPEEASVPADGGFNFFDAEQISEVDGDVQDIYTVIFGGDSPPHLYIASPSGDRLICGGDDFEDITEVVGLGSRSAVSAWGDFTGDGELDLASFDGEALTIWSRAGDGEFTRRGQKVELPEKTHTLVVIKFDDERLPGLLAAHEDGFLLLKNREGEFEITARRDVPDELRAELGEAGQAVVADLTNNGLLDMLQLYEEAGLLYRGVDEGVLFADPEKSAVASEIGAAKVALGDLDADGLLDILATSLGGVRFYHNVGDGRFVERVRHSGEASYKTHRFASFGAIGDPNSDGRDDVLITYYRENIGLFFNRGFLSFGHADVQTNALEMFIEIGAGQRAGTFADLAGDGAQGIVIVLNDGGVWFGFNENVDDNPLYLRVDAPPSSGIISVKCDMPSRSLGRKVASPGRPAIFGIPEPGLYSLEWRSPGQEPTLKEVLVIAEPVNVTIEENE